MESDSHAVRDQNHVQHTSEKLGLDTEIASKPIISAQRASWRRLMPAVRGRVARKVHLTKTKSVALLAPYDNVEPSSSGLETDNVIRPSVTGALDLTI